MQEKTITEVMREPIVGYDVIGVLGEMQEVHPYEDEQEALDAAAMLESAGAKDVIVNRRTLRVVEEVERIYPPGNAMAWQVKHPPE